MPRFFLLCWQPASRLHDPDADIHHGAYIFGEGDSRVLGGVYLFKPYSVHIDICCSVTIDYDFALISNGVICKTEVVNQPSPDDNGSVIFMEGFIRDILHDGEQHRCDSRTPTVV